MEKRVKSAVLGTLAIVFCGLFLLMVGLALAQVSFPWWLGIGGLIGAFVWLGLIGSQG